MRKMESLNLKKITMSEKLEELLYYLEGLDDSVIKLNDYIADSDFEFVKYTLDEFEEKYKTKFKELIPEDPPFGFGSILTRQFQCFNHEILRKKYVVVLNDKQRNFIEDELDERVNKLIQTLKLFKSGHIKLVSAFEFPSEESEESGAEFFGPIIYSPTSKEIKYTYSLSDENLSEFKVLQEQLE